MGRMFYYFMVALAIGLAPTKSSAGTKKYEVKCPAVIADLNSDTYAKSRNRYACFSSVRGPQRLGLSAYSDDFEWTSGYGSETSTTNFDLRNRKTSRILYTHDGQGDFIVSMYSATTGQYLGDIFTIHGDLGGFDYFYVQDIVYFSVFADGYWTLWVE